MLSRKKTILLLVLILVLILTGLYGWFRFSPYPGLVRFRDSEYSLAVYSREKTLLAVLPLDEGLRRQFISSDQLSREQIRLILDSEDKRFYFHPGVDLPAQIRSLYLFLRQGEIISGGSTISMQLARIISPHTRGLPGKISEMYNALRLETRLSKREILTSYISHLPFGHNVEGLESAAYYYFTKHASDLSAEELCILMMIPRRPEDFNPLVSPHSNKEAVLRTAPRLKTELSEMGLDRVYLRLKGHNPLWPRKAPHFIELIKREVSSREKQEGKDLITSLSDGFQEAAGGGLRETVTSASENRISNGAVLAIENATGQILAYQGSVDFSNDIIQGQIDGVQILRQPGSTLKPFLYASALEQGYTVSTPLADIPMEFGHQEIYIPENYNERCNGPVRLSVALGSSLNIPAVFLAEQLGVNALLNKLVDAGFSSLSGQGHLGVGIALGNGEVSLWELAKAFSLFSREGKVIPLDFRFERALLEGQIEDAKQVYSPEVAELIRNILSDRENRILGFGRTSPLEVDFDALFKTGTSNQFNNIWAVGSSQDITVAAWMGNFSGETVLGAPGSSFPARLVVTLLKDFHREDHFQQIVKFKTEEICSISGMKAGPECPYTRIEKFREGTELSFCSWHRDGELYLPVEYASWIESHHMDYKVDDSFSPLSIVQPRDGAIFYFDPALPRDSQVLPIRISGTEPVDLYLDEEIVFTGKAPFSYYAPLEKGRHVISVKGQRKRESVTVLVK